jgi:hypothetical protein
MLLSLLGSPLYAQVSDEQVDQTIARGVAHLWSQQKPDGTFTGSETYLGESYPGAPTVMAMLALAYAGESLEKPEMQKGFKALMELDLQKTYTVGFRVIALAELYQRADKAAREGLRNVIRQDVTRLLDWQLASGGWIYEKRDGGTWDFSNTQLAVLALREAARAGVEIKTDAYLKVQKLYLDQQQPDGGWNYGRPLSGQNVNNGPSYGAMTAAGVASLFVTREALEPDVGCPCRNGKSTGRRNAQVDQAIAKGVAWLGQNFATNENVKNPTFVKSYVNYWLYACERVGIATGYKYLGTHNWYAEGATAIVGKQAADGGWGPLYDTSLALLFLIKGRAPILLNKVQFDGDWDMHPRDAANLASYVGTLKEQRINWQIIHLDIPVAEWHDAPILYISAESPLKLTDDQKKRLREFTDGGGTVLFEASCGNQGVITAWKAACKAVWPEWELKIVDKDHPLWTADQPITSRPSSLMEASDGVRSFLFFSMADLSCAWHTMGVTKNRPLFDLGANLYTYTTDHGRLRGRLAGRVLDNRPEYAATKIATGSRATLRIRLLKHGGDWHLTQHYGSLARLAELAKARAGLTLQVGDAISAGAAEAKETDVLWLTGRKGLTMSDEEAASLKAWLGGGGYLVAEVAMGGPEFEKAFVALLPRLGLELKNLGGADPLVTGKFDGAGGYDLSKVEFTYSLITERVGKPAADLRGLYLGGKLVGVYSPFDVSLGVSGIRAWGCRGYAPADARAAAINLLLPATTAK